jgi:hypothetical protein
MSSLSEIVLSLFKILKTIAKSNYLNYSDEWARNKFRFLGYDKRTLPQSSMKSKNKVSEK